jgi:papain like protease
MSGIKRITIAAGAALAVVLSCKRDATGPKGPPGPPNPDSLGPGIVATTTVDGKPGLQLANGERVQLLDMTEVEDLLQRFPPPASAPASAPRSPAMLPASVSLRQYQTPVKDQNPRGTCFAFASAAAIEAEYKRSYGVTVSLSVEYANLVGRMLAIYLDRAPTLAEGPSGTGSGGTATYLLQVFSSGKYGIPDSSLLPYLNSGDWGNMTQQGDMPYLDGNSSQRAVDDFNLNAAYAVYKIPQSFGWTVFPRQALDSAKYRATQVLYAAPGDLQSVNWFKTQLAGGHEVAFGFRVTKNSKTVNGVWMPGDTVYDGHVMLMVGYADSLNAFLVKNSWGAGWGDGGYTWFSYDWVTKQVIANGNNVPGVYEAVVVQAVAPPNNTPPAEQRFLGRWSLDQDGVQGILDIYRVPGLFGPIGGKSDYRLGTYFGPDSVPRRVNGTVVGNQLEAYVDWGNSGIRQIDDLSGLHFSGVLVGDGVNQARYLAGTFLDNRDGHTYGFYGHKGGFLVPMPTAKSPDLTAYLGTWRMDLDGMWGSLRFTSVDSSNWSIHGTFVDSNQVSAAVAGLVSLNRPDNIYSLLVGNRQLAGYMFNQESGILAGSGQGGFVALHSNFPPSVQITYPASGATLDFDTDLLVGTALRATGSDYEDGTPCCAIDWKVNGQEVATGSIATYQFGDTGTHTVTAIVTDLDGATAQSSVTFRLVNNPPTATILKPTGGQHFTTGLTYNNALEAQTWLTGQGKTITYTWTSSDGTDNFPKNGATPTNVVFGAPGARTLTLTVADNYGLQAQSTVGVVVDTQPTAPTISFLAPLDSQNLQSLTTDTMVWVNLQIVPSSVQGRVVQLVWQGDKQNCVEQTVTLYWNLAWYPPADAKDVWGDWNTAPLGSTCFGQGINGWLRIYVTDPNASTQMAQVYLFNPVPPHVARKE